MRSFALALVMPVFLTACASTPSKPVSDAQLGALAQGQTTRAQAFAILGEPTVLRSNREGMQLVYAWRPQPEAQKAQVVLSFDGGEVLRHIERSGETRTTSTSTSVAMP